MEEVKSKVVSPIVYQLVDEDDNQVILETINRDVLIQACDTLPVDVDAILEVTAKKLEEAETTGSQPEPVVISCHNELARAVYYQYSAILKTDIERKRLEQEESVEQ